MRNHVCALTCRSACTLLSECIYLVVDGSYITDVESLHALSSFGSLQIGIFGQVLTLRFLVAYASSPEQVMAYSSHTAQSNGFLQTAGKAAAPTAHRGVSAPKGYFACHMQMRPPDILEAIILLREISPF